MTQSEYAGKPILTRQALDNTHVMVPVELADGTLDHIPAPMFIFIDDPSEVRPEEVLGHYVEETESGQPTGRLRPIVRAVALLPDGQSLSYKSLRPQ